MLADGSCLQPSPESGSWEIRVVVVLLRGAWEPWPPPGTAWPVAMVTAAGHIKRSHAQKLHSFVSSCTFGANSSWDQAEVRLPLKPHFWLVFLLPSPAAFISLQVTPESSPFTNYLHENSCLRLYFWAIRAHTYIHI